MPIEVVDAGAILYRSHQASFSAIFYSVGHDKNRFDDPNKQYGVCYCARSPAGAFVETFLRQGSGGFVDAAELRRRSLAEIEILQDLRLVPCYGNRLVKLGATAGVTAHDDVGSAQAWSAAIFGHPDMADGILYRMRHDNDQLGVALFDRSDSSIAWVSSRVWPHSPHLGDICDRYDLVL